MRKFKMQRFVRNIYYCLQFFVRFEVHLGLSLRNLNIVHISVNPLKYDTNSQSF